MNKPLILVVEDDPSVRNLITTTLKTNDYRYVVAPNGSTAIMEATSHNPEIILLDLGLPDMDGVQVIQTVRSWSNVPIIVISARSEDNDKIKALDAGADDYLTKPFSVEELLARLRVTQRRLSLMTAEMFTASSVFVNGKLKVDYAGGCAYLDENELHLTPIEYKLLCLLSKNVGKVLTHTFITQNIWGRSWDNDVASLRVFMATLRKKLEPEKNGEKYLNAVLNQRSNDLLAAGNWNVCQYAVLVHMVARHVGMKAGELVHVIANAHIYDRHIPIVKELIKREQHPAPDFWLNPEKTSFYSFTEDDVRLDNYQTGEQVRNIPIAV